MALRWLSVFADVPERQVEDALAFWSAVTATGPGQGRGDRGQFVPLQAESEEPYVWVQRLQGDDRPCWHLDLHVDDLAGAQQPVAAAGATVVQVTPELGLVTLTTPAGQPFCVVEDTVAQRRRPVPRMWPDGTRSLLDQVCLDLPADAYDQEAGFWQQVTGWPRTQGALPEFERLTRPAGLPLRLLLQRVGAGQAGRAHVDLACDDVQAEVRRHQRLGATVVARADSWTTLRDPVGLLYCTTSRTPE